VAGLKSSYMAGKHREIWSATMISLNKLGGVRKFLFFAVLFIGYALANYTPGMLLNTGTRVQVGEPFDACTVCTALLGAPQLKWGARVPRTLLRL